MPTSTRVERVCPPCSATVKRCDAIVRRVDAGSPGTNAVPRFPMSGAGGPVDDSEMAAMAQNEIAIMKMLPGHPFVASMLRLSRRTITSLGMPVLHQTCHAFVAITKP